MKRNLTILMTALLVLALPMTAMAASRVVDCPYAGCWGKADLVGYSYKDSSTHYCIYQCREFPVLHVSAHTYTEAHSYTREAAMSVYFASAPTCTQPAKYYKSCACGAKGTETFDVGEPLDHIFIHYVSNNDATCAKDGTVSAVCSRPGCNAVNTVTDVGSRASVPHTFGDWFQSSQNKPGMLQRDCKVCGYDDYRFVEPLQTKDYPVVQVLADAAKALQEGDAWYIVNSDQALTAEELEALSALSPLNQALVFTSVIGYEDQVNALVEQGETFTPEAAALKDAIAQRMAALQGEEAAALQEALDTYFPTQIIVLDPYGADYDAQLLTVRVTTGGESRDDAYGFRRTSGVWSFCQL